MKNILIVVLVFTSVLFASDKQVHCTTSAEVLKSIKTISPGMSIVLEDGVYSFDSHIVIGVTASKEKPVIIMAKNRNGATITGATSLLLRNSSFVTIEGLVFENTGTSAIRLEGCNNVRITRNIFRLDEKGRGSWVLVTGNSKDTLALSHHNTIDRNLFENKRELGNFLTIEGTKRSSPVVSQYDVIELNHFRNIGPRAENALEAIRIGSSDFTLSRGYTVLRNNLFERCDGDPEYISIKLSDCAVLNNTFIECLGSLSLRHGNHSTVTGNVIIGNNRTGTFLDSTGKQWTLGTGGVRFCADSMTITGNYFEGLTGKEWDATIAATNGDADYGEGKSLTKHFRIRHADVSGNIIVNNISGIEIGFDGAGFQGNWWNKPPEWMSIKNNIIVGSNDTLVKFRDTPANTLFENNIVFPAGNAAASTIAVPGIVVKDPELARTNGFLLPKGRSLTGLNLYRLTPGDVGPNSQ